MMNASKRLLLFFLYVPNSFHLERLEAATVSVVGISSIVLIAINGCPQLICFRLRGNNQIFRKMVEGMLQVAGRKVLVY